VARAQHHEADDRLALDLVRDADDAGLRDGGMAHQHGLDLCRTQPLARDLERVIRASWMYQKPSSSMVAQSPCTQTSFQRDQYVSS